MTSEDLSYRLDGRVATVTGAAGGMGVAICRRLARLGATPVLLDLPGERLTAVAEGLRSDGIACHAVACDITNENEVIAATETVSHEYGRCDILVNNAGALHKAVPLESLDIEIWMSSFAVNTTGAFLCTKHFGAMMLAVRSGNIVNIGSTATALPTASAGYGVTKTAVLGFTRQVAVEWGPHGIRANIVSPGFILTPLSQAFYADPVIRKLRETAIALRRIGTPEDVAAMVSFLASDAASYVTGQEIRVDGGFSLTSHILTQPQRDLYAEGKRW
jgi:NAD(P)-dependent dehydrogenase (short-subunit alcohol dehydrogenase family)